MTDRAERGEYRALSVALRDDPEFQSTTPATKLVFYTLVLNLGRVGIGALYPGTLEAQTGLSADDVAHAYAELEGDGARAFDVRRDAHLVWIVHRLADEPTFNARDAKHRKAVQVHVASLPPRSALVVAFRTYYAEWLAGDGARRAFEGPSKALGRPFEASGSGNESERESGSGSEADEGPAHDAAPPAPLSASLMSDGPERQLPAAPAREMPTGGPDALDALVERLWRERYRSATPERWADVVRQLEEVLTPEGTVARRRPRQVVRATPAILARAIEYALREPIENPDRTIVVVLRKCTSGDAVTPPDAHGRLPSEALAAHDAAEQADADRVWAERQRGAAAWLAENPDEGAAIERELDASMPGDGPSDGFLAEARAAARVHLVEDRQRRRARRGTLAGALEAGR